MFGYVDRDGDGWRDKPDGTPLVLEYNTEPDQLSRLFLLLWKKNLDAIGVRIAIDVAKWPEHRKKSKAGQLQTWQLAWGADYPDGENFYQLLYGPNCGSSNDGCFELAEFDALYDRAGGAAPGPERTAVYQQMARPGRGLRPVQAPFAPQVQLHAAALDARLAQASDPSRRLPLRRRGRRAQGSGSAIKPL
jgi:ABC-type transport system substrate-binding protein